MGKRSRGTRRSLPVCHAEKHTGKQVCPWHPQMRASSLRQQRSYTRPTLVRVGPRAAAHTISPFRRSNSALGHSFVIAARGPRIRSHTPSSPGAQALFRTFVFFDWRFLEPAAILAVALLGLDPFLLGHPHRSSRRCFARSASKPSASVPLVYISTARTLPGVRLRLGVIKLFRHGKWPPGGPECARRSHCTRGRFVRPPSRAMPAVSAVPMMIHQGQASENA